MITESFLISIQHSMYPKKIQDKKTTNKLYNIYIIQFDGFNSIIIMESIFKLASGIYAYKLAKKALNRTKRKYWISNKKVLTMCTYAFTILLFSKRKKNEQNKLFCWIVRIFPFIWTFFPDYVILLTNWTIVYVEFNKICVLYYIYQAFN